MSERLKRLEKVNILIQFIANHGRRFFYVEENERGKEAYGRIRMSPHKRLFYVDPWNEKLIYLHYRYWMCSHGGALRQLIDFMKRYIQTGEKLPPKILGPWPEWYADGDPWGYGEDMEKVREMAVWLEMYDV